MCFGTSLSKVLSDRATRAPDMPNDPINITRNNSITSSRPRSFASSRANSIASSRASIHHDSGISVTSYASSIASENSSLRHHVRRRNSGSVRSSLYNHPRPSNIPR